ncbi:mitotic spindle assembly checkpoint protein MAD1-like isoform X1 [Mizuhopecten yessoensis]|uniref:mitotic spindle assembly checkpoint protein MAD1-like isoform X1 n=2 Tax=Mizuhopecten yessoensis TaxID=6573 RepID=UPI000B45BC7B|nr:mitotic spindle assembly checkpoint protein MAD1-like isoform X1 [Mizuhopecten yessoensis]
MSGRAPSRNRPPSHDRMERSQHKVKSKPTGSPPAVYPGRAQPFTGSLDRGRNHADRPTSGSKASRLELGRTSEAAKLDRKPHTATSEDSGDLSDLRKVLHVVSELQKIDLGAALNLYKTLMKKTKNEEHMVLEEKYLEAQNERMEQLTSGTITREREDIEYQFNTLLNEKERLKEENEKLESKCKESESLLEKLQRTKKENRNCMVELKSKDEALKQAKIDIAAAMTEKNEALTRLSKELGTKLSDNNPTIADLSDPNRAMKLGEKYNELYDNEWTDAMEKLGEFEDDDRQNVQKLLDILKVRGIYIKVTYTCKILFGVII